MKGKWRRRLIVATTAMMAGLLMSHGLPQIARDLDAAIVYADDENTVGFTSSFVEASDSTFLTVTMRAVGNPNANITVTYRTSSGTAIEGVDYNGVYNSVDLKLDPGGSAEYVVSVKLLTDANTREKLRISTKDPNTGEAIRTGRYFNLWIVSATNAKVSETENRCQCYLPYDYRVSATTGLQDTVLKREVAYIDDYKDMYAKYHAGDNDISGKETWKTWKEGVSFNDEKTKRWVNTYINPGFASAYGSYVLKSIDDDKLHSTTNIHMLSGNRQFMDNYSRSSSCPGLSLYYQIEPCKSGGYRINGKAMNYIADNVNPYKKQHELVDMVDMEYRSPDRLRLYWIQKEKAWFSNANSIYDSTFYKTEPYGGVLDYGLAIYNGNKSWDREVHNIWLFLTLLDSTAPTIQRQYTQYDQVSGSLRIYLRFNEPVYASKQGDLDVRINNYVTKYAATYVEGNYSDTLVYEIKGDKAPKVKIGSLRYQLFPGDVGDLAYRLDQYKNVSNNLLQYAEMERDTEIAGGTVDLGVPKIAVDVESSPAPNAIYNLMLSANGNGETAFDTGTVYYSFDDQETILNYDLPSSYQYAHPLTSDELGSFNVTLAKNESLGIVSGDYYLHALAVSQYGFKAWDTFGPYRLDGDAPKIDQLSPTVDILPEKNFQAKIGKKALGTLTDTVTAIIKYNDASGKQVSANQLLISENAVVKGLKGIVTYKEEEDHYLLSYHSYIDNVIDDVVDESIILDQFILNLMGERPRINVEISFQVVDAAGNKATSNSVRVIYDKRKTFKNVITAPDTYVKDESGIIEADVYDITAAKDTSDGIVFSVTTSDIIELLDAGAKYTVVVNDETTFTAEYNSVALSGLEPGYYEAVAHITDDAGNDLVSDVYAFYLTYGMNDMTLNRAKAEGNMVLTNRVFQIEDAAFYYFRDADTSVSSYLYGATYNEDTQRYEGGSSSPAFSSSIEAKKYVRFMEYRDLELISISSAVASILNGQSGSSTHVKAPKETKNAVAGQLWIRYKRATWNPTMSANSWVYYYYGEGKVEDGLNVNGLSPNLISAIDAVTNTIIAAGAERFLVGEENLDSAGAPMLDPEQMHVSRETHATTMAGNTFVSDPVYAGDAGLYQNNVKVNGETYPIATNLKLSLGPATALFFRALGASNWTRIEAEDGALLRSVLSKQPSGVYSLREYGEGGVAEFDVYVDQELPLLNVTINKGLDKETEFTLDGSLTVISCQTITLNALLGEDDPQAYVAVYSAPRRTLMAVLYAGDVAGYTLEGGNYYLEVGDRSGNFVTYSIRTTDSPIDLQLETNDDATAIYIRTNNRDASEIAVFDVYVNEELKKNVEFAPVLVYRDPGVYRVDVMDIYGNVATATATLSTPTPNLTWYYLNDSGSLSAYDPNRPVKMTMSDDPTSSRTTNIYASTTIAVALFKSKFDNTEVDFEVIGAEQGEDYEYNASTGLLSFKTLKSWRLRVWYREQPENDHLYVFHVDADAPEVSATCIGDGYHPSVVYDEEGNVITTSTFDSINADKYEVGDFVNLDTLAYVDDGQASLTFHDGNVISAKHITLHITDSSGIRLVTVTRDGSPVTASINADGDLILLGYGAYVVTIVDNLGNTTTFRFTNLDAPIAVGTIDGESILENAHVYGHDSLDVTTFHGGTTTVLIHDGGETYTFEFHYDDGVLTFGRYVIRLETQEDEGQTIEVKVAEYEQTIGFSLVRDNASTTPDVWYQAAEGKNFVLYAMIDLQGYARFRVQATGEEIGLEVRFEVGSVHLPSRFLATLSTEAPTLDLLTGGKPVERVESLEYIYITDDLTVDESTVSPHIVSVGYCYSQTELFGEDALVYEDGEWTAHILGEEYGYYRITVSNIYGNKTVYVICKIASFASIVTITCLDDSVVTFKENDGSTFHSNRAIDLVVFSTEVRFEVNGVVTTGYVEGGTTTLSLNRYGVYHVRVIGTNGISEEFDFEIATDDSFLFDESWIIGYNEKALLRDQGYTNQSLSIVLDDEVVFVDMTVNDDRYFVLYDNITDDKRTDPKALLDAVGRYGVGKYTIGFRNKYGDLRLKTVYYNNIPSIILTRQILSDPTTSQTYDLGLAIAKGFYSNHVLSFSTTSTTYVFMVNGEEFRLDEPKVLKLSNASGNGSLSYAVSYLDEYGNYVEFDAILIREDVEFDDSAMAIMTLNGIDYTRDDVVITFGEDLKATLSIDGKEAVDYVSGEVHYADGEYRFVVRDIAGNNVAFTVVHKSVNHYALTVASTGVEVIDGGVVNDSNVLFEPTDDSYIKYVVRNGKLVEGFSGKVFSMTGHYEIIVEDGIGNRSYEEFTILKNSLAVFRYTAPTDYEVTEVWRLNPDGSREIVSLTGRSIVLDVNGDYLVVVTSASLATTFNFSVSIDNSKPSATLEGVEDGGVTARDVSIVGTTNGDIVEIYKDGELISTTTVDLAEKPPVINSGGKYRVVITNVQGVTIEYSFIRKAVTNVPGSVFVIIFSVLLITAVSIGLTYHTKLKTDN